MDIKKINELSWNKKTKDEYWSFTRGTNKEYIEEARRGNVNITLCYDRLVPKEWLLMIILIKRFYV